VAAKMRADDLLAARSARRGKTRSRDTEPAIARQPGDEGSDDPPPRGPRRPDGATGSHPADFQTAEWALMWHRHRPAALAARL